jgi:hypothetical protein
MYQRLGPPLIRLSNCGTIGVWHYKDEHCSNSEYTGLGGGYGDGCFNVNTGTAWLSTKLDRTPFS